MYSEDEIKTILATLGVRPSKERGQNFLFDLGALDAIVTFGNPLKEENIIEIGPGLGVLTEEFKDFPNFQAVELESRFCSYLKNKYPEMKISQADILNFNFKDTKCPWTVFANLPYSISSPVILKLIDCYTSINRAVLLLQKEFAERLFAEIDTKDYGSLSVQLQLVADVQGGPIITGDCFYPSASVESQVVEIKFLKEPKAKINNKELFDKVLRSAFSQRRKKLLGLIVSQLKINSGNLKAIFNSLGIDPDSRAENLSLYQFAELASKIEEHI